jgi:hypothetical protein
VLSQYELKKRIGKVVEELGKQKLNLPVNNYPSEIKIEAEYDVVLLDERNPIKAPSLTQKSCKIVAIDSSSRYLRDASVNMVLVGVAAYSNNRGTLFGPYDVDTPFLGISTYTDILSKLPNIEGVRVKNYINEYFDEKYRIDDMADEIRIETENIMLKQVKDEDLVIIDGPLYPTPLELSQIKLEDESRIKHQRAYANLVKDRIRLLKENMIGIVKRLENSYKLGKIEALGRLLNRNIKGLKDPEVLKYVEYKLCGDKRICLIGPIRMTFSSSLIPNAPDRFAYYLIIRNTLGISSFFRIESINLQFLDDSTPYIVSRISERLIPTYIEIVDNLSKKVSASLFITAYPIASRYLTIIHDDKLAYYDEIKNLATS